MSKTAILSVRIISDAKNAVAGLKEADGALGGLGAKLAAAHPGMLAVGGALVTGAAAAGKALYDLGGRFDEVQDTIRVGTGATGDALTGLVDVAHNVATSVPTSFEAAGSTVADLNTRLGLSGDTLQTVASQYLEAGRILGEDVDINATSAAFSAFKIEGDNVSGAMDDLFRVSQATGVGMNDLATGVQGNAQALQTLGFGFSDSIALVGMLDKAGVDSTGTLNAMRKGMLNLAKPGEDMQAAFARVTGGIQDYIDKGDTAGALDLASQVFGTKGAAQMVQALQTGKISLDDLMGAAGTTGDTILGVGQDTQDAAEKWTILKNKGLEALEPLASGVFDLAGKGLDLLSSAVDAVHLDTITAQLKPLTPALTLARDGFNSIRGATVPVVAAFTGALIPVLNVLRPIAVNVFQTMASVVRIAWSTIVQVIKAGLTVLTGVFNIIRGIFTGNWRTVWTGAKQVFSGAWTAMKAIVSGAWSAIKAIVSGGINHIRGLLGALGGIIGGLMSSAWARARSATSTGVSNVVAIIRGLPGQASAALGSLGSLLWSAGSSLIQGFIDGITSKIASVRTTLSDLTSKLTSWKGPADRDATLLQGAGRLVIGGFINGLEDLYPSVRASLSDLTGMVASTDMGSIDAPTLSTDWTKTRPTATAGTVINVTVNGALDPVSTARQIKRILAAETRRGSSVTIGATS